MIQSKLGFYDLRNKSPTHLWRSVFKPPYDPPIVPLLATRWHKELITLKIRRKFQGNFEIWAALIAIGDKGYRNGVT